jgi:hypothetical protein
VSVLAVLLAMTMGGPIAAATAVFGFGSAFLINVFFVMLLWSMFGQS